MKNQIIIFFAAAIMSSCNYLDVVPDKVATLDNAFSMRSMAERYLFTCYSWMPEHGDVFAGNPGFTAGDEFWFYDNVTQDYKAWRIALGNRSEEHTSELQSLMRTAYAVFCLKKKKKKK